MNIKWFFCLFVCLSVCLSVRWNERVKRTRQMKRSGRWIDLADPADKSVRQTRQRKRSGRPGRRNGPADQLKPAVIKTHGSMTQSFEFKIIYPSLYQPVCLYVSQGGGGGGVLWYFHTHVRSVHFLGFKILNFDIFWGFQKNKYFFGYEKFVVIFWGSSQNWTIFRGHFYAF